MCSKLHDVLRSVTKILGHLTPCQLGYESSYVPSVSCFKNSLPASHLVPMSVVPLIVVIPGAYIHVTLLLLNNGTKPNSGDGNNFIKFIIIVIVFYYWFINFLLCLIHKLNFTIGLYV